MELKIIVQAKERFFQGGVSIVIDDLMSEVFEPLRTCDEPIMQLISGEIQAESIEARKVLQLRKDAAEDLAKGLTKCLLEQMQKHDTHNGYKTHQPGGRK